MTVHTRGMHQHLTHCQELQSKGNFCGHGLVQMHASSERCYRAAKFSGWLSLLAVLQVLLLWVSALKRILLRIRVLSQGQTLKQVGGQDSSHHYWLLAEFSVSAPYMQPTLLLSPSFPHLPPPFHPSPPPSSVYAINQYFWTENYMPGTLLNAKYSPMYKTSTKRQ